MKKFIAFLIMLMFVFSFSSVLATEQSGEKKDNVIYLETYEQYQELLNSMNGADDAKSQYIASMIETIMYDVPAPVYRAKVVSVGERQQEFAGDESTGYQMYVYQNMTIRMLEGEYAGEVFEECMYPLKADSFYNIKMPEIKAGSEVYVAFYDDGENITPYVQSADASVSRSTITIIVLIVATLLTLVYTGKHGMKILLPIVLLVDLLFIVFSDFVLNYIGVWAMIVGIILLVSLAFFALRLGVNSKMVTALISLTAILSVMTVAIYGFDMIAHIAGISYEASALSEKIYPVIVGNEITPAINFHDLSVGVTVLLMALTMIPVIAKAVENLENNTEESKDELRKYLAEKILFVVGILLVTMIQKYMIVYLNVGSGAEILNSEMLTIEASRIMFVVIGMALSITITEMVSGFLEDK